MMSDRSKPEQDPAEGARDVIDRELAGGSHKKRRSSSTAPSGQTDDERRATEEPAEGSREIIDRQLAKDEGGQN